MGGAKVPKDRCPTVIERFIRMEANLCTREEKLRELFGITDWKNDPGTKAADDKMYRWRKHPMYDEIWKDELAQQDYADYSEARRVLRNGMKSKDGWLAMNSAVNVISNGNKRIFKDDDQSINIRVESMPDIGTPDQEE